MRTLSSIASVLIAAVLFAAIPLPSSAQLVISVGFAPPALPTYTIPQAPAPNYIWTPGYWAWGSAGYYWVPGTWVPAPQPNMYWTPGYWGYNGSGYGWNAGYWAPQIGFYGGIPYDTAYPGTGFIGGMWTPGGFSYNTAVAPVSAGVTNVYVNRTVINKTVIVHRVSYNGGRGGIIMRPDARQLQVMHERHIAATDVQTAHVREAENDRNSYYSVNHGHPTYATVQKPLSADNRMPGAEPLRASDKQGSSMTTEHHNASMESKPPATHEKQPAMHENQPQHHAPAEAKPPAGGEHHPEAKPTDEHKPPIR
ncbi:MAG: YXWGXW repeat-containing protein [Candidatus Eremiobacteraeota bacterium]|nr:YXWGXW repeat-containing protein [Candidatus Eremiobacteraeota bacterium]